MRSDCCSQLGTTGKRAHPILHSIHLIILHIFLLLINIQMIGRLAGLTQLLLLLTPKKRRHLNDQLIWHLALGRRVKREIKVRKCELVPLPWQEKMEIKLSGRLRGGETHNTENLSLHSPWNYHKPTIKSHHCIVRKRTSRVNLLTQIFIIFRKSMY